MFHRKAVVGGIVGGAVGAAVGAGVAVGLDLEIGWIAWALGGVVGFGVALITAASIAGGQRKTAEEVQAELLDAVRLAMIKVMLADGTADDREQQAVRKTYQNMTGIEMPPDAVEREISAVEAGIADLDYRLGELAPYLNDAGKSLVIRAALIVAASDGEVPREETDLILEIGTALGMDIEQLTGLVSEFLEVGTGA